MDNNIDYCNECGGEIVDIACSVCHKTYRSPRNIGSTKRYLQEKICDAKKSKKTDSLFYNKDFVIDITGDERLGRAILCASIYWNYDKIINNGRVRRKSSKSVIDIRPKFTYLNNEESMFKKKVIIDIMKILGTRLFVAIGFDDEKNLIISSGFVNKYKNKKKKKKRRYKNVR
jgi:hypothetical protein